MKPQVQRSPYGAAYIRYSSTMQDDSFSLDAQLRQIHLRAKSEEIEIVKVYSDPATSAYKNRYRPGIAQMLEDARRGTFHILYVHKVDRLARRLEWAIEIVKQLQSLGVTLKAVEQNFNLDLPEGKLMFHLLGSLGEFYSDNLSKETHKGKYERVMQGYHNGWAPWAYKSELVGDRKMAVLDPEKADIAREMFERYSTGLYFDQQIADWLNEKGMLTFMKHPFTKDSVREMLQNPFYMGYLRYQGAFAKGMDRRGRGQLVKGIHEPVISQEVFEQCQKVRSYRRREVTDKPETKHTYMLAGLLTCRTCGRSMRAQAARSGRYYRDASRYSGISCLYSGLSVRAESVETQIGKIIEKLVLPDNWQASLSELLKKEAEGPDPEKEKGRINSELRRMREAYKHGLYENDEAGFWREIDRLQLRLKSMEESTPFEVRKGAEKLVDLQDAWKIAVPQEKKELCQILFQDIIFDFGTRSIHSIRPRAEYALLFQIIPGLRAGKKGEFFINQSNDTNI